MDPITLAVVGIAFLAGCSHEVIMVRKTPTKETPPKEPEAKAEAKPADECDQLNTTCAASENSKGWFPGIPVEGADHFFIIGSDRVSALSDIHSLKNITESGTPPVRKTNVWTQFPKFISLFESGQAVPADSTEYNAAIEKLGGLLVKSRSASYEKKLNVNVQGASTVYVSGHSDRVASSAYNSELSAKRAEQVANSIVGYLEGHKSELQNPIAVKSAGFGESNAENAGREDGKPNPEDRKVEVIISYGPPVEGWTNVGTVAPAPK